MDFAHFGINGTVEDVNIRIPRLIPESGETSTFDLTTVIAQFVNSVTVHEPSAVQLEMSKISQTLVVHTAFLITLIMGCGIFLAITILLLLKFQMLSLRVSSTISVNSRELSTTTV